MTHTNSTAIALCAAAPAEPVAYALLAAELPLGAEGQAPEWVQLLPAGDPLVSPRDGRQWRNPDPAAVLAATVERGLLPLPIDTDHAGEMGPGHAAPAAGWIEELSLRGGAIWGRVAWTEKGAAAVQAREYRYLSPAFVHTRDDRRVLHLSSAALVNRPAFPQLAVAAADNPHEHEEHMTEEERKALCAALKLPDTATPAEIVAAAEKLRAEHATALAAAGTPPLDKFVPRADYDAAVEKATAAEAKLTERVQAEQAREIDAEISKAVEGKKITPATADYYRAMCKQEGGLEQFREFLKAAPELAPNQVIQGDPAKSGGDGSGLTEGQLALCRQLGVTPEDFAKEAGTATAP